MRFSSLCLLLFLLSTVMYAQQPDMSSLTGFADEAVEQQLEIERFLIQHHTPETYRDHLYQLTRNPNIAGTDHSRSVIEYMSNVMDRAGLDVTHNDYDVWLPEPGEVSISLIRPIRMPLNNQEYIHDEDPHSDHADLVHGWNAYSGTGEITAEIVYANHGRKEDFEKLQELGVNVEGKIVIARYGGNFRGFKAKFAEEAGAAGLIIYTDPMDNGYMNGLTYPDGKQSNESTIQRGSLLTLDYYGDPLTPFEPALPLDGDEKVNRLDDSEVDFHTIPVTPIGYGAAEEIFSRMNGEPVPSGWQGGLPYTYRLTGGSELEVELKVDQPHDFKRITNVIGTVEGSEYPDEWIILGSHHDAWGFGATDPNSGTAMLLTLAESLGEMVRNGHQPKRSIMIGHWDAEEFMLIGSSEWAEELGEELGANAIMYLNADAAVTGSNFRASAAPSLKKPIIEASKMVPHPDTDETLYESWITDGEDEPGIGNLGGGSDHVGFYMHLGIPSAGISISSSVPVYHSNFDTFYNYETHLDGDFHYGPALAGVYGVVSTRFANADVLPYDLVRYATDISSHVNTLKERADQLERDLPSDSLEEAVSDLKPLSEQVESNITDFIASGPDQSALMDVNQKLIQLERSFLHEDGLPFSKWQQSLYVSTDPWSGYASWMLPGARYALEDDHDDDMLQHEISRFTNSVEQLNGKLRELNELMKN